MGKTMAEVLIERGMLQGELKGRQDMLLRQLKTKFKKLPGEVEAQVRGTTDEAKLDAWADEVLTAAKLTDMSFMTEP